MSLSLHLQSTAHGALIGTASACARDYFYGYWFSHRRR